MAVGGATAFCALMCSRRLGAATCARHGVPVPLQAASTDFRTQMQNAPAPERRLGVCPRTDDAQRSSRAGWGGAIGAEITCIDDNFPTP